MSDILHYVRNYIVCLRGLLKENKITDKEYKLLFDELNDLSEKLVDNIKPLT